MKRELKHMNLVINSDSEGILYIEDCREGLVFIRENSGESLYNLTVIINKDSFHFPNDSCTIPCEEDFGIVFENITHQRWEKLAREYVNARRKVRLGLEEHFMEFMDRELYFPIDLLLDLFELLNNGLPHPSDPEKVQAECKQFLDREIPRILGTHYDKSSRSRNIEYLVHLYNAQTII